MPRYFIEVAYVGTRYSGFQVQLNSNTIQAEIERAFKIFFHKDFALTGSSRTDAGVHALQNFFHFDSDLEINRTAMYNLNALLPYDIVIKNIFKTAPTAHCRFDATARNYQYKIIRLKNPFYFERAYYYPYKVDIDLLHEMSGILTQYNDFTSFSKKNTQVKTFNCTIQQATWTIDNDVWMFEIKADRFLRGMVKGLVGTMLRLAKNNKTNLAFIKIIEEKSHAIADFSVPSEGLFLTSVEFRKDIL